MRRVAHLAQAAVRLVALCALSAATEMLLPERARRTGVRFLMGLTVLTAILRAIARLWA